MNSYGFTDRYHWLFIVEQDKIASYKHTHKLKIFFLPTCLLGSFVRSIRWIKTRFTIKKKLRVIIFPLSPWHRDQI